jgi:hypothetical protein
MQEFFLKFKQSTSLQQGTEDMKTALSQATEVVKKAQKSLKLAKTELDIAGAIDKAQKKIVNARGLLKLDKTTTLQQGLTDVMSEAQKTKTKLEAIVCFLMELRITTATHCTLLCKEIELIWIKVVNQLRFRIYSPCLLYLCCVGGD